MSAQSCSFASTDPLPRGATAHAGGRHQAKPIELRGLSLNGGRQMRDLLRHRFWHPGSRIKRTPVHMVAIAIVLAVPGVGHAVETCTMYEKYVKDHGSGASCATTAGTAYADHTPTG